MAMRVATAMRLASFVDIFSQQLRDIPATPRTLLDMVLQAPAHSSTQLAVVKGGQLLGIRAGLLRPGSESTPKPGLEPTKRLHTARQSI